MLREATFKERYIATHSTKKVAVSEADRNKIYNCDYYVTQTFPNLKEVLIMHLVGEEYYLVTSSASFIRTFTEISDMCKEENSDCVFKINTVKSKTNNRNIFLAEYTEQ